MFCYHNTYNQVQKTFKIKWLTITCSSNTYNIKNVFYLGIEIYRDRDDRDRYGWYRWYRW